VIGCVKLAGLAAAYSRAMGGPMSLRVRDATIVVRNMLCLSYRLIGTGALIAPSDGPSRRK